MQKKASGITEAQCGGRQGHPESGHRGGETQFKVEHRQGCLNIYNPSPREAEMAGP